MLLDNAGRNPAAKNSGSVWKIVLRARLSGVRAAEDSAISLSQTRSMKLSCPKILLSLLSKRSSSGFLAGLVHPAAQARCLHLCGWMLLGRGRRLTIDQGLSIAGLVLLPVAAGPAHQNFGVQHRVTAGCMATHVSRRGAICRRSFCSFSAACPL